MLFRSSVIRTLGGLVLAVGLGSAVAAPSGHSNGHSQGHGHAQDQGHGQGHGHSAASIGEPASPKAATRTVEVVLDDVFFQPTELKVAPGETVRFILHNEGEMMHEFNLGTAAMHRKHQAEMQQMMADSGGHMMSGEHHHGMAHDDPNSVLLEPGESAEFTWRFPEGGNLEFACNVPGHYEAGMRGPVVFGQ